MNGKYQINLRPDNCICDARYRDCKRGEGKPRWYKLSERLITKHCMLCCSGNQSCSVCAASDAELCKSHYVLIRKVNVNALCANAMNHHPGFCFV